MAVCFPYGVEFGIQAAKDAVREMFYPRHDGDFETVSGVDRTYIMSPYSSRSIAEVGPVDAAGSTWTCVEISQFGPYRSKAEIHAFDCTVTRIAKERGNHFSA